jgi:hypothetical protein
MKLGWLVLPTIAAGCAVATSAAVAGRSGALISISLVAAVPLIVLAYSLGRPVSRPRPPEREPPPDGWQTFTDIAIELGWAKVSRRHFDHRPRPAARHGCGAGNSRRRRLLLAT